MRAVVVEASPNREGSSVTLARSFIEGLREGGEAEVSELFWATWMFGPASAAGSA
jgi:hypothetical protein